ncbi:MAG: pyridoxamine 5'-phosphate oxidase family protein [Chloroflexi bacterium]|nr:pyridoxamine 5'-phosphate oxidase family protein [Chloroflexota bacterium]
MSRWQDVVDAAPEFAERVRSLFQARKHKTLATLRSDGSPRISGTETEFVDGEIWLGMMPDSLKARDLRRDARLALHSPSVDAPPGNDAGWAGEAKIAGRGVVPERTEGPDDAAWFRIDISEVVVTSLDPTADHLVIESWHPGRGLETRTRK